jgi:hypothetical protein
MVDDLRKSIDQIEEHWRTAARVRRPHAAGPAHRTPAVRAAHNVP